MPVDYRDYPANWKSEIRPRILKRDGHKCKICSVPNHTTGWRDEAGEFHQLPKEGVKLVGGLVPIGDKLYRPIGIVLTIAHLEDHDPMNCADDNLAALCQKCHLKLDQAMHIARAAATRARKHEQEASSAGQLKLF